MQANQVSNQQTNTTWQPFHLFAHFARVEVWACKDRFRVENFTASDLPAAQLGAAAKAAVSAALTQTE